MKDTKYFYNVEAERLYIAEIEDGELSNILELSDPLTVTDYEEEEVEEEEPVPVVAKKKYKKRKPTQCSDCGEEGHTKRTCPNGGTTKPGKSMGSEATEEEPKKKSRSPQSNDDKIQELISQGRTDTEIYNIMGDFMTDAQLREALEFARIRS